MAQTRETRTGHTLPREITIRVHPDGVLAVTWPVDDERSAAILGARNGGHSAAELLLGDVLERIITGGVR